MMSFILFIRLIGVYVIGGSFVFFRYFCIKVFKKNCFLDNFRICCKIKDIFFFENVSLKVMYDFFVFNLLS